MTIYLYRFRLPGSIYHKRRKLDPSEILSGECVFFDHVSGFISIKHQGNINFTKTVKDKLTFDREDKRKVVMNKIYHT